MKTNNKTVKTVKNNNTVVEPTVETTVDEMSWKQAKAIIKWGCASNGLALNLPEIKVTAKDKKAATAIVKSFAKPNEAMIPGIAWSLAAKKVLTDLGMTKKSAGMILDGKLKPETMIKRLIAAGFNVDVLSLKFAPVAKESAFKPVAQVAAAPQPMAFFAQETVAPTGATGSDAKAKIKRLIAAGFSVDEALAMVGL